MFQWAAVKAINQWRPASLCWEKNNISKVVRPEFSTQARRVSGKTIYRYIFNQLLKVLRPPAFYWVLLKVGCHKTKYIWTSAFLFKMNPCGCDCCAWKVPQHCHHGSFPCSLVLFWWLERVLRALQSCGASGGTLGGQWPPCDVKFCKITFPFLSVAVPDDLLLGWVSSASVPAPVLLKGSWWSALILVFPVLLKHRNAAGFGGSANEGSEGVFPRDSQNYLCITASPVMTCSNLNPGYLTWALGPASALEGVCCGSELCSRVIHPSVSTLSSLLLFESWARVMERERCPEHHPAQGKC